MQNNIQWNLDLTKCQGTGEIGSLYQGLINNCFFSIIVLDNKRVTVVALINRGSTVT